jgi:hypothetical protein
VAIARTGRPFALRQLLVDGRWTFVWAVPLSAKPSSDWIRLFLEGSRVPGVSPALVTIHDDTLAFTSTVMEGPTWLIAIDRWIASANRALEPPPDGDQPPSATDASSR